MDLSRIQELLKLMESHGLGELEVEDKGFKVRLKKAAPAAQTVVAAHPMTQYAQPAAIAKPSEGGESAETPTDVHTITSPLVGTFYRQPTPEAESFVEVGDPVDMGMVVCIVEAMKVMNEVKAEVSGTVRKVLVESGKPVEYGQPLFLIAK
jgi:acetyl-CoA carboxylase biotin carboxyl carrier protein